MPDWYDYLKYMTGQVPPKPPPTGAMPGAEYLRYMMGRVPKSAPSVGAGSVPIYENIGKSIGQASKWLTPATLLRLALKRGIPAAGVGWGAYDLTKWLLSKGVPGDWYFNPTEENLYRQFEVGGQLTPYAQEALMNLSPEERKQLGIGDLTDTRTALQKIVGKRKKPAEATTEKQPEWMEQLARLPLEEFGWKKALAEQEMAWKKYWADQERVAKAEEEAQATMRGVTDFERKKYLMQLEQQLKLGEKMSLAKRADVGKRPPSYEDIRSELLPERTETGELTTGKGGSFEQALQLEPGLIQQIASGRGIGWETPQSREQRGGINQQLQASFGQGLSKIVEPKAPAMWTGGEYSPIFQGETAYQPVELSGETATGRGWRQSNERVAMMQDLAGQFEQARAEILSTTAPRDWIIRAKAERAVNPYSVVGTPAGTVGDPMTRYYAQLREQVAPEVPQDLTKFLGAGTTQQKFGTEIAPPSGQAWAQAPWETQQRLFGYAEGLGGEGGATNLLEEMRRRLPYNPSRGARWSPASQR